MSKGEECYTKFKQERLEGRTVALFETIPKAFKLSKKSTIPIVPDIKKETVEAIKLIDYALKMLLNYELTSTSFSFLRKSAKSELARKIEEMYNPKS